MYRRVAAPIALAVGVWIGFTLLSIGPRLLTRAAVDNLAAGKQAWLLPVVPSGDWYIVLAVFAAVRMCALRGGSRPECILVGLSPLIPAALFHVYLFSQFGFSSLPTLAGLTSPFLSGTLDLGTMIAARQYAGQFLGLIAACITATWLYLWVDRSIVTPAGAASTVREAGLGPVGSP